MMMPLRWSLSPLGRGLGAAEWAITSLPGLALLLDVDIAAPYDDAYRVTSITDSVGGRVFSKGTYYPSIYAHESGIGGRRAIHFINNTYLRTTTNLLSGQIGAFIAVFRHNDATLNTYTALFGSADEATSYSKFMAMCGNPSAVDSKDGATETYPSGNSIIRKNMPTSLVITSDGSQYRFWVNGVAQTISGTNNGRWWGDIPDRDNMTVGVLKYSNEVFKYLGDIALIAICDGQVPSDQDIADLHDYISEHYEIAMRASQIAISTPVPYTVYQRNGSDQHDIAITGTYVGTPTHIEARFNGGSWTEITASPTGGAFSGTLSAQGACLLADLEVRFSNDTPITFTQPCIGIGDIFICDGQSNMSGRGDNSQATTGVYGLFGNDYRWKKLTDPYDRNWGMVDGVSNDGTAAGSWVLLLADAISAITGYAVAFVPCALGGTLSSQWLPSADHNDRTTFYGSANYRTTTVGGARCALWWQGEQDAYESVSEATYNSNLDTIANAINADQGIKLMPCKLQNLDPAGYSNVNVNAAITTAWADNANVLTGPDFSDITPVDADQQVHFRTDAQLQLAASRWATAIATAFGWT